MQKKFSVQEIQNIINKTYDRGGGHHNPMNVDTDNWNENTFDEETKKYLDKYISNWTTQQSLNKEYRPSFKEHMYGYIFITKMAIHWRDGYVCNLCGKKDAFGETVQVDHIIPKSKFKCNHPWNLQSTCADCNIEKSNRLLDEIPIFLKGAIYRSKKFFKKEWLLYEAFRIFNMEYGTKPVGNDETEQKETMRKYGNIISKISEMENSWKSILLYLQL